MELGQTYTFVQVDRSNYYHPLGITQTANTFFQGRDTVGRETYKRRFFEPSPIWTTYDDFSMAVRFDILPSASGVVQYYCLIHKGMEGLIQLTPNGEDTDVSNPGDELEKSVENPQALSSSTTYASTFRNTRSLFDQECGTYGLGEFQLPNAVCPDRFICGKDGVTEDLQHFSACLEAANCHMMSGMTTGVQATEDSALFVHQMIPHHQNAVNTAKTLLKMGSLLCPDLQDQENPDCVLEGILREIVAGQNHQIQLMRKFLADYRYPAEDNCDVFVETVEDPDLIDTEDTQTSAASGRLDMLKHALLSATCIWGLTLL